VRAQRSSGLLPIALAVALLVAACGQKGPLILPGADETGAPPADGGTAAEQPTRDEEEDN